MIDSVGLFERNVEILLEHGRPSGNLDRIKDLGVYKVFSLVDEEAVVLTGLEARNDDNIPFAVCVDQRIDIEPAIIRTVIAPKLMVPRGVASSIILDQEQADLAVLVSEDPLKYWHHLHRLGELTGEEERRLKVLRDSDGTSATLKGISWEERVEALGGFLSYLGRSTE